MKQFRPYHFPPLHQFTSALPKGTGTGGGTGSPEEWQAALTGGAQSVMQSSLAL